MTLYQWLTVLGIPAVMGLLIKIIENQIQQKQEDKKEREIEQKRQKDTNSIILRVMMRRDGERYVERDYASLDEKDDFEECYIQYHANGGNGVMDALREKVLNLPNKKEGF